MSTFDSWQTPAALAVVCLTLLGFLLRWFKNRKSKQARGCGTGCACPEPPRPQKKGAPPP